jgi:hypothetical protein
VDFRRAQSRGEWPGARITFCRGRFWGGRVEREGLRVDEVVDFWGGRAKEGGGIRFDGSPF